MAKSNRKPSSARPTPGRAQSGRSPAGSARTRPPTPGGRRPTGRPGPTAPAISGETPLRTAVANRSRGIVVWLSRQSPLLIPAVMLALMLVGLVAPLVFALPALVVVALFVCWLAFLSWPVLGTGQRAIRFVMIAIVIFAMVGRIAGWL